MDKPDVRIDQKRLCAKPGKVNKKVYLKKYLCSVQCKFIDDFKCHRWFQVIAKNLLLNEHFLFIYLNGIVCKVLKELNTRIRTKCSMYLFVGEKFF